MDGTYNNTYYPLENETSSFLMNNGTIIVQSSGIINGENDLLNGIYTFNGNLNIKSDGIAYGNLLYNGAEITIDNGIIDNLTITRNSNPNINFPTTDKDSYITISGNKNYNNCRIYRIF